MSDSPLMLFRPFLTKGRKHQVPIQVVTKSGYEEWYKQQDKYLKTYANECGFEGKTGQFLMVRDREGITTAVVMGSSGVAGAKISFYDGSQLCDFIKRRFSKAMLGHTSFFVEDHDLTHEETTALHVGWAWAVYEFTRYKKDKKGEKPALVLSARVDKKRALAIVEAVGLIRDLVNIPANDLGPEELEKSVHAFTKLHKVELDVIRDKDLLKRNLPMIYAVGKGSSRRPRLMDFSWGNPKHPKVTLVGKGVCFDTGGLDIKPSSFMYTMKKDMGGAAHVLALAHLVIEMKLPIHLRVLIPSVENSISGDAFRPADVLQSRKGLTVEVGDTDAEGRLILADALTYACEKKPELLIDFATLTGAARVALGEDLPAMFSTNDKISERIKQLSFEAFVEDPVWPLPLWQGYRKDLESSIADISSTGKGKAGAINAALFMQAFIDDKVDWVHMDVFSWESNGRTGKSKGGADTGLRTIYAYLEDRYGKRKSKKRQ